MYEILFNIASVLFLISVFALPFFCAVKPNINIARWFYLSFGVSIIFLIPRLLDDIDEKWLVVWPLLLSLVGFLMFIAITKSLKEIRGTEKEKELNKKFQEVSIKGGKRKLSRTIIKK